MFERSDFCGNRTYALKKFITFNLYKFHKNLDKTPNYNLFPKIPDFNAIT